MLVYGKFMASFPLIYSQYLTSLAWGLVIVKKQIDISFLCICPLTDDKLRHNIVNVAVKPRAAGEWFHSKL